MTLIIQTTQTSSSFLLRESVAQQLKVLLLGSSLATLGSDGLGGSLASDLVGPGNTLGDLEGSAGVALRARQTSLLGGRLGVLGVLGLLGSLLLCAVGGGGNGGLANGIMDLGVHGLKRLSGFKICLDVTRELVVVLLTAFTVALELLHVASDVDAEDVLPVSVGVVLAVYVARKAVVGVGNVQAAVDSAFEDTEDASAGGGAAQTNIQNDLERVLLALSSLEVTTVRVKPAIR
jgi:hypothetical protein